MRQDYPIVLMSFDRPELLEQVARTLAAQVDANLSGRSIALFQDGAVNPFSGLRRAADSTIAACVEIFHRHFPHGRSFVADDNLGVALNFDRAERYVFEELNADAALFFEDDMLLSPHYVRTLDQLTGMALNDSRIGYVAAYGIQGPESPNANRASLRYETLGHFWGFGLPRRVWLQNRRFVEAYLQLVRNIDYRQRDARAIHRLHSVWGVGFTGTSQDCAKHLACVLNGAVNLNISLSLGRYIGATGLHMDPGTFELVGLDRTELYSAPPPPLPALESGVIEEIGRTHQRWAAGSASPFPSEHPIPGFPLWNFALAMLNTSGVEPALVVLHDRLQLSVSLLLFCCWHGSQGRRLSADEVLRAVRHVERWERDVLARLRDVRRTLAGNSPFGATGLVASRYFWDLCATEQDAWKVELEELQRLPLAGSPGNGAVGVNLDTYLSIADIAPDDAGEIDVLVAACEALGG